MKRPLSQLTRVCIACGLDKPIGAFLQLSGAQGMVYGNICSACRNDAKEKIIPLISDEDDTEGEGGGPGLRIDNKTRVQQEIEGQELHKKIKVLNLQEKQKREKNLFLSLEDQELKEREVREHRENYIEEKEKEKFLGKRAAKAAPTGPTEEFVNQQFQNDKQRVDQQFEFEKDINERLRIEKDATGQRLQNDANVNQQVQINNELNRQAQQKKDINQNQQLQTDNQLNQQKLDNDKKNREKHHHVEKLFIAEKLIKDTKIHHDFNVKKDFIQRGMLLDKDVKDKKFRQEKEIVDKTQLLNKDMQQQKERVDAKIKFDKTTKDARELSQGRPEQSHFKQYQNWLKNTENFKVMEKLFDAKKLQSNKNIRDNKLIQDKMNQTKKNEKDSLLEFAEKMSKLPTRGR